ncbi:MAG: RDD family protein [Bacilli bacterium]|nr:RDD family protein [Bacilli bacterium]
MKRTIAYAIDTIIILAVSSLISSIPFLNKGMDDYQKTYDEYEEEYNKYSEYLTLLDKSYKDEEITEEEYTKLTESTEYKGIIETKYEDKKLSQDEYDDAVEEINEEFDKIAKDYVYILSKKGISNSIITLVCTLLYFGVIQYFLKGETIGKKIFKLKVISANNKKLNIFNYLFRSLIVNDILLNTIGILFLAFATKTVYLKADSLITTLVSVVEAVIIFLVLTREDQRGLHDLLFNTKVISTIESNKEDNKIIEVDIEEKEVKNVKSKRKKQ